MNIEKVLVYAEITNSKINPVYFELMSKARALFEGKKVSFACAVVGSSVHDAVEELKSSGTDKIYLLEDERLDIYNPEYFCAAIESVVKGFDPDVLLIGATLTGEEIAPTMGLKLKTGVAAHCMDLILKEDGNLAQMVPAFGGKVIGEIFTPNTRPQIASVKPGIFVAEKFGKKECEVVQMDKRCLDDVVPKIKPLSISRKESAKLSVEKSPVIVCGGYGTGSKENWEKLEKLASLLGGATGCTRPVIDVGWADDEGSMIGTSGKSVRPKLYIGCGISGATHHVCGMKDPGVIININSDEDAESFSVSDYKVVGNSSPIIDKLIELIEETK